MRGQAWVAMLAFHAGCLGPAVQPCSDGTLCPTDKACAPHGGCASQDQIDACRGLAEDLNCTASSLDGAGVCSNGICRLTEWIASAHPGDTLATEISLGPIGVAGLTTDRHGNVYVAEPSRVRRIDPTGVIAIVAGNGVAGSGGDGGPATDAQLTYLQDPSFRGLAVDRLGNLFISDYARVRRVDADTGIITTVAGNGIAGFGGDGGAAIAASIQPAGIAVDGLGNLFIADSTPFNRIRCVDVDSGRIATVAGNGVPAVLSPGGMTADDAGNLYVADKGNNRVVRIDIASCGSPGVITPIAGTGFSGPVAVALDAHQGLYVADQNNNRIRRIDLSNGSIATVAGSGAPASAGDGGPATEAALDHPDAVATDGSGNVYIADQQRVRRVDAGGVITTSAGGAAPGSFATTFATGAHAIATATGFGNLYIAFDDYTVRSRNAVGTLTTVAGNGSAGFSGDGGPAGDAQLQAVNSLAVDTQGNLYIADTDNFRVRRVDATTHVITTVAGNGTSSASGDDGPATQAGLEQPWGLALDGADNLYIADASANTVRRVEAATGLITTIAGTGAAGFNNDGIPATVAKLAGPRGVAVDALGRLYIADTDNHRVRLVDGLGVITTIAGKATGGFAENDDGGPATAARLKRPIAVALDAAGNFYIADQDGNVVRRVDTAGVITSIAGKLATGPMNTDGFSGDGGPASIAQITQVMGPGHVDRGLSIDAHGLYFADSTWVRRIDLETGIITSVVGQLDPEGVGPIDQARLVDPRALAVVNDSLTVVASAASSTLEAIYPDRLSIIAGWYPQDAVTLPTARFRNKNFGAVGGVAFDSLARVIYLTESTNDQIDAVQVSDADPTTWTLTPLFLGDQGIMDGPASAAQFTNPTGLHVDTDARRLYVADTGNQVVRAIDLSANTLDVSTLAGTGIRGFDGDGGSATTARLDTPTAVTRCGNGDIFVADTGNHRVRRIDRNLTITTVLGDGSQASSGAGAPSSAFPVDTPLGLACDPVGNLFVTSRTTVRMVLADPAGVVDGSGRVQTIFGALPRDTFPAAATRCLTGLVVIDHATVQMTDACTGMLIELHRKVVP